MDKIEKEFEILKNNIEDDGTNINCLRNIEKYLYFISIVLKEIYENKNCT